MLNGYVSVVNKRTGKQEILSKEGLINLANAIIENACQEYMHSNSDIITTGIEHFLLSDYGRALLRTIEPEYLILKMKGVKFNGKR